MGIKAIIGESFAEIFYSNCIAIGILCFTLPKNKIKDLQKFMRNKKLYLEIDIMENFAKSENYNLNLDIKESTKNMFLSGEWDATSTLLENKSLIDKKGPDLPYLKFNSHFS